MIQHAKATQLPLPCPKDRTFLPANTGDERETDTAYADESLDYLLKYALKTAPKDHDLNSVWQRLSNRMRGPFGSAALEAPAFPSLALESVTSGGRTQPSPFVLSDKVIGERKYQVTAMDCLWEMLRFDSSGKSRGGGCCMLA